ncbi:MAG: hypothetical protein B7Z80_09935 [Rhodospirillales bacterium 20-64-7]|nr:MAG: hypothetical protein B7Z80_09935 [Rhodospirillales bacterium 20-64-7]HQT76835.1 DUF192 domain-containing protein [Rhodopila sp.]
MKRRFLLTLAATALPLAVWAQMPPEPTKAQPELPKEKLVIVTHDGKQHPFNVEMATTPEQQQTGEMFRKNVPEDSGMLFVWPMVQESSMWMKNTLVPLDMVFINPDGKIRSIVENTTPRSLAVISSGGPVKATLELAGGVTAKLDIRVGDTVKAKVFGNAP